MEKEIKLRSKKKSSNSLKKAFADKKKRYPLLFASILPVLIVVGFVGVYTYKEVKSVLELAKGDDSAEIRDEYIVTTMGYRLRDNATEYQMSVFSQLKDTLESEEYDDLAAVELVAKSYIADFYTFTNKAGQYDIGGMYYWYSEDDEKTNAYLAARDGFYKYISYYMNQYGAENLIEVEDVQVTKCTKESNPITLSIHWTYEQNENGDWVDVRKDFPYDTYNVSCTWTYKEGYLPSTTKFATSLNMIIIKRDKFEIIYTSEKTIDVKQIQQQAQAESAETEDSE